MMLTGPVGSAMLFISTFIHIPLLPLPLQHLDHFIHWSPGPLPNPASPLQHLPIHFFIPSESQGKNQKVYYLAIPEDKYSSFLGSQVYIVCEDSGINSKYLF